jgi:hypothetical protein
MAGTNYLRYGKKDKGWQASLPQWSIRSQTPKGAHSSFGRRFRDYNQLGEKESSKREYGNISGSLFTLTLFS